MPGRLPAGGTCGDDLGDYVKKTVAAHHGCIQGHYAVLKQTTAEQAPDPARTAGQATAEQAGNRARVVRARQRYGQVQKLKADGMRIAAIQRELRLAPGTARHYFHATSAGELVAGTLAGWPGMLDEYKPHLHQRQNEGCTNIWQLHQEVKALGFRGSYGTVYAYLRPFTGKAAPPAIPRPRSVTSPAGSAAAPTTSTPASSSSSPRYGPPAPTWTPCAATSRSSPR
jgi:hypothetical protein